LGLIAVSVVAMHFPFSVAFEVPDHGMALNGKSAYIRVNLGERSVPVTDLPSIEEFKKLL
jgi:hypothetical protein